MIADGIDPGAKRQAEKRAQADTFEAIAHEHLELRRKSVTPDTLAITQSWMEKFVFPYRGSYAIASITASDLLAVLRRIESNGTHETAHRVRAACGRVFRYAIATGRAEAERDIASDLRGALAPVVTKNFAAITDPVRIGELLRAIDGYKGQPATACALRLAPLVFVRPGELRMAEWGEFDLDGSEWRIPAERMKAREQHVVPLSLQAAVSRILEIADAGVTQSQRFQAKRLGREIHSDEYKLAYGLEEERARNELYTILTIPDEKTNGRQPLPPQFFYGIDDWRTCETLDEAAIRASHDAVAYSITIDSIPPQPTTRPLSARSIVAIFSFVEYPKDYDDPLDDAPDWDQNWDRSLDIDQGARRYVAHTKQTVAIGGKLYDKTAREGGAAG